MCLMGYNWAKEKNEEVFINRITNHGRKCNGWETHKSAEIEK